MAEEGGSTLDHSKRSRANLGLLKLLFRNKVDRAFYLLIIRGESLIHCAYQSADPHLAKIKTIEFSPDNRDTLG